MVNPIAYAIGPSKYDFLAPVFAKGDVNLKHKTDFQRDDEEIVKDAILQNYEDLQFASMRLRNDADFMLSCIREVHYECFKFASDAMKDHEEFVKAAVKQDYNAMAFASERLRNDDKFMSICMTEYTSECFEYVGEDLKNNKSMAHFAVKMNINLFNYISPSLQNTKDLALLTLPHEPYCINYLKDPLINDFEIKIAALLSPNHEGDIVEHMITHGAILDHDFWIQALSWNADLVIHLLQDQDTYIDPNFWEAALAAWPSLQAYCPAALL